MKKFIELHKWFVKVSPGYMEGTSRFFYYTYYPVAYIKFMYYSYTNK
jgi:hypothetical protein